MTTSIEQTVRTEFDAQFPALRPTVPYAHDGFDFDPKTQARDAGGAPIPWLRVSILPADRFPISLGADEWRNIGVVWIQGFAPAGTGTGLISAIIGDAGSVFEGKTLSGVTFRAARRQKMPREEAWERYDVRIDYLSDEIP